ncbi:MAG: universal stress protein [Chloroflexota bacterium]
MFKTILVPLDGSLLSECALAPALALAQTYKAKIVLVTVLVERAIIPTDEYYDAPASLIPELEISPMKERLTNYLDSIVETRAGANVPMRAIMLEGSAADCVVETAVSNQTDLVIMGTHGRSGMSRWLLGSVTQKVIRNLPCPIMAIRDERPIKNILITLDQTMLSEQALDPGFAVAGALNARVHLLTIIEDAAIPLEGGEWSAAELKSHAALGEELFAQEEAYLHDLEIRYQTTQPIKTAVRNGKPQHAILAYAAEQNIDLIVMATHNRAGVKRWLYKSVTKLVMNGSQCSMLILKPNTQTDTY